MARLSSALCVAAALGCFAAVSPAVAADPLGREGRANPDRAAGQAVPDETGSAAYGRTDPDVTATGYTNDNGKGGTAARARTHRKALRDTDGPGNANTRGMANPAFDTRADASGTMGPKTTTTTTTGAIQ